jgi:hypothetical protein
VGRGGQRRRADARPPSCSATTCAAVAKRPPSWSSAPSGPSASASCSPAAGAGGAHAHRPRAARRRRAQCQRDGHPGRRRPPPDARQPRRRHRSLASIEDTGREAMRRCAGSSACSATSPVRGGVGPQPSLAASPTSCAAGSDLPVEAAHRGRSRGTSPAVSSSACTASCRRPSPTCGATPARSTTWRCALTHDGSLSRWRWPTTAAVPRAAARSTTATASSACANASLRTTGCSWPVRDRVAAGACAPTFPLERP